MRKKNFTQDGEALEQDAQKSCGCSIPGGSQGQPRCGPGQPGQVGDIPARGRICS